MKVLFVYPETPTTFWSFHNALKFISKKSAEPPLGLLTVAAMLPEKWDIKLIDMNVTRLKDEHLHWADYVFLTGMNVQRDSFKNVVSRCNEIDVKVVAGGPMCTTETEEFSGVDHFVLNEAEVTLPLFLDDFSRGTLKPIYTSKKFPDISQTPIPMWNLLDKKKYANMSVQYSRGCPYNCEFCSITLLNGHKPRTKTRRQFLAELEALYQQKWRGDVFIVDDNFIGNKGKLKTEILPGLIEWSQKRKYPFSFNTEVSINLADDEELVKMMVKAGFNAAFIGIETPNDDSLTECGKAQNQQRDMIASVKKLQHHGLVVAGGFIVGFDNDPPSIFKQQINFIQKSGIVTAMVGLLNAPTGTRLFNRLKSENRLLKFMSGDNMDGSLNFIPTMNYQKLVDGYKEILNNIYSQKEYYERVITFLREYRMPSFKRVKISFRDFKALIKSLWMLGILEKGKRFFWKLILYSLFRCPRKFPIAMTMAIYGFHFRRVVESI